MDCSTARRMLEFALPRGYDLEADDRTALESHLAHCGDCDSNARSHRQFDDHLGHAIRTVPVPTDLKDRLLKKLHRQRDEWWKQWANVGMRWAAAAAVMVGMVWAGLRWKETHKERLDADELIKSAQTAGMYSPPSADDAENWFRKKGHRVRVPEELNAAFLKECGFHTLNGREVPWLQFRRESQEKVVQIAGVYILSAEHFNLDDLPTTAYSDSGYAVRVKIERDDRQVNVIVYDGDLKDMQRRDD